MLSDPTTACRRSTSVHAWKTTSQRRVEDAGEDKVRHGGHSEAGTRQDGPAFGSRLRRRRNFHDAVASGAADGKSIGAWSVGFCRFLRRTLPWFEKSPSRTWLRFMFVNQAFGASRLRGRRSCSVIDAVGAAHYKSPHAARSHIHLLNGGGKPGPHHFTTCSGSVHASNTRARGAVENARVRPVPDRRC